MIHRIHLKGPWDFLPLESAPPDNQPLPAGGTVKFPAEWQAILGDFRGMVRFSRRFNRPSNLESDDRVYLALDGVGGRAEVLVNQQPVGSIESSANSGRCEITPQLQLHNLLEVNVFWQGTATDRGGLWGPIAIEIFERHDLPPAN